MFIKYNADDYNDIRKQHNIMVLVGNGFDIAALKQCSLEKMRGKTTSYSDFYDYVEYFGLCSPKNKLYQKMTDDRKRGKENWCDFENSIDELLTEGIVVSRLEKNLGELQNAFTRFLNDIVTADVLIEINDISQTHQLAIASLSQFLGDLTVESKDIYFPKKIDHFHLFNFLFVNFNYTMLLDNYICLDKNQFDPHQYKYADRNFNFFTNPTGILNSNDTFWSSYVLTNVIHPHGVQSIPRSMIFGTEKPEYDKKKKEKRMMKSYWAQDDLKYKRYFNDTELYIIYGMSLSKTDGWWLDKIFESLLSQKSELIIYHYGACECEKVKKKYCMSCITHYNCDEEEREKVFERIYVVCLENNHNYFLGYPERVCKTN